MMPTSDVVTKFISDLMELPEGEEAMYNAKCNIYVDERGRFRVVDLESGLVQYFKINLEPDGADNPLNLNL